MTNIAWLNHGYSDNTDSQKWQNIFIYMFHLGIAYKPFWNKKQPLHTTTIEWFLSNMFYDKLIWKTGTIKHLKIQNNKLSFKYNYPPLFIT